MTRRKISLYATAVISLSALLAGQVSAQDAAPKPETKQARKNQGKREAPIVAAMKAINLTDEQKPKVQAVMDKFQTDLKAMRQSTTDREQSRAKMGEMVKKMREDLTAILTPEQQQQLKDEMKKRNAGGNGANKKNANKQTAPQSN